jgi:restriction system protein
MSGGRVPVAQDPGGLIVNQMIEATVNSFKYWLSQWYMWAFIVFILALKYGPGMVESARLRKAGMPEIDRMTGLEFEKYLEILFGRLGYQVERTRYIGDQGGDLILAKGGERILVQAKRHSRSINNKAIQEAAAARPHYKCHRAMVVANQEFTRSARDLAASNQVELWGRHKLAEVVLSLGTVPPAVSQPHFTPAATKQTEAMRVPAAKPMVEHIQTGTPTCRRCGKPMVLRESARGKFWGCSGFPKCRYTATLDSTPIR